MTPRRVRFQKATESDEHGVMNRRALARRPLGKTRSVKSVSDRKNTDRPRPTPELHVGRGGQTL
jgi:hypothetical protein